MTVSRPTALRMTARRMLFASLVAGSFAGLAWLMVTTLSPGGFSPLKTTMFVCFLITLPWTVIGFWNAVIGLLVMRLSKSPSTIACPIEPGDETARLEMRTAILSCVRDEDPTELETRLAAMLDGLARTPDAEAFSLYILSDSSRDDIAAAEKDMAQRLARHWSGIIPVTYRRRDENPGFKAGNISDFCERWGDLHEFALVLDADSYMSAEAIVDLARRIEANPQIGILQSLVVGLPTASAFARVFQFGMRLGMRSYTIGSAWWQGDCGPYWGHNAILRLEPFRKHCHLPILAGDGPLGGYILSHDQVEAVLMRRAGYEVRVLPQEGGSYEENPPHLLEFIRRDLRWCQGNLQYLKLLGMRGLKPVSRAQLILAILMFAGSPAWIGFMISAAIAGFTHDGSELFRTDTGFLLFITIMTMVFAPKLATVADVLCRRDLRTSFGGTARVVVSTLAEILYSAMLAPIMATAHTMFIGGLIFGKSIGWGAQGRGVEELPVTLAARKLWPQTIFGVFASAWIISQPLEIVWPILPIALGPLLAIPFAVALSSPKLGLALIHTSLWRIPEETIAPRELFSLNLIALNERQVTPPPVPQDNRSLAAQPEPIRVKG